MTELVRRLDGALLADGKLVKAIDRESGKVVLTVEVEAGRTSRIDVTEDELRRGLRT